MTPVIVTDWDEEASAPSVTQGVSHDVPDSPTLPPLTGIYRRSSQRLRTEESGLLAGPSDDENPMQEDDAISLEVSLRASSISYDDTVDTRDFQEELFQGLPARRTRATTKKLEKITKAEPLSSPKNLYHVEGGLSNSDDETYEYEAPEERKEDFVNKDDDSCSDTCLDLSVIKTKSSKKPGLQDFRAVTPKSPVHEAEKRQAWHAWIERKEEIKGLLVSVNYGIAGSHGHGSRLSQVPALTELENHGIYSVEQRVCVVNFKYNDFAFSDFARRFPLYLELLEEAAGRNCGVVKVILPHLKGEVGQTTEMRTPGHLLCMQRSRSVKKIVSQGEITMFEVKSQQQKNVKYSSDIEFNATDSVKNGFDFDGEEQEFLARVQSAQGTSTSTMKTTDNFNMARVRRALELNTVELSVLPKDSPKESLSTFARTDPVRIYVAQSEGISRAMHMDKNAAYSINYLHKGKAKVWTVVKPFEHTKFEEIIHMMTSPNLVETKRGNRPHFPPPCDQFLSHKELYIPGHTLESLGIVHRQVVQEQNEMIIMFPYAYHQAYDTGANISEEMSYATKRSENFLTRDLYRQCGPTCSGNGSQVQSTSAPEGYGDYVRHKQLAQKSAILDNKTGQPHEGSARVRKRKLDDCDAPSASNQSGLSARKKKTLTHGLPRGGDGARDVLKKVDHGFAHGYGKDAKPPGEGT